MKELDKIVDKALEGNYLMSAAKEIEMKSEILALFNVSDSVCSCGSTNTDLPRHLRDVWSFETKCRRCNHIEQWVYSDDSESVSGNKFVDDMHDRLMHPKVGFCKKCKEHTLQDLVAYTSPS